ncbi:MAG: glycosyltransferase [Phycisphaerales bacterium]|nr:glycosyltransferase [Phycisphaerales bacterium]
MNSVLIDILFVILLAGASACAVFWGAVAVHVWLTASKLPTARDGVVLAEQNPPTQKVCVIVPCHNEAGNISRLIGSLKEQDYDRLRVVLALDRCTDDTLGVARAAIGDDARFEIVEITKCPDDWAGKVHAAHSGYSQSEHGRNSEVLIFTDADTWLDRACVRSCVALLNDRGLDFLSLLSTLNAQTWYERIVQPITAFELARQYPLMRVNREDNRKRAFANGQFMMFTADAYTTIEGHSGVKGAILEDIEFARGVMYAGFSGGLLLADNMLKCRMYDTWEEYIRGWKRIYSESANREVKRLKRYAYRTPMLCTVLPLSCVLLILLSLVAGDESTSWVAMLVGGVGLGGWYIGLASVYRMSKAPLRDIPGSIIGAVLTGRIFKAAANDLVDGTPTQWGGKSYVRKAEES